MTKYRGFINEVSWNGNQYPSPISSGETIDRFKLSGLNAAFSGPRVAYAPTAIPVMSVKPAPAQPTVITRSVPYGGIPGDIRDITARSQPGEAIVDAPDDMTGENGVPGVDDSGAFPYGDPRAAEITAAKPAPQNFVPLAIAAAIAFAVFGG